MTAYTEEMRNQDFDYFVQNYQKLFEQFGNKFLAIRNKSVIGSFNSVMEAIEKLSDKFDVGTYLIQECNGDESAYKTTIMRMIIRG